MARRDQEGMHMKPADAPYRIHLLFLTRPVNMSKPLLKKSDGEASKEKLLQYDEIRKSRVGDPEMCC